MTPGGASQSAAHSGGRCRRTRRTGPWTFVRYLATNVRNGGKFNGFIAEGVIAF
jgi:hypothetical protein